MDEGKNKEIITARATPIKSNALAKKNLTTARKHHMHSPEAFRATSMVENLFPVGNFHKVVNKNVYGYSQTSRMSVCNEQAPH